MVAKRPDKKLVLGNLCGQEKYGYSSVWFVCSRSTPTHPCDFVHGDGKHLRRPGLPMINHLCNDRRFVAGYQFWVFSYPSGYPYPYAGSAPSSRTEWNCAGISKSKAGWCRRPQYGVVLSVVCADGRENDRFLARHFFDKSPSKPTQLPVSSRQFLKIHWSFQSSNRRVKTDDFIATPHRGSITASNGFWPRSRRNG